MWKNRTMAASSTTSRRSESEVLNAYLPSSVIIDSGRGCFPDVRCANSENRLALEQCHVRRNDGWIETPFAFVGEEIFPHEILCGIEMQARPSERPRVAFLITDRVLHATRGIDRGGHSELRFQFRCHSFRSRLTVKAVMFAVFANCSLVISRFIPTADFWPIPRLRLAST